MIRNANLEVTTDYQRGYNDGFAGEEISSDDYHSDDYICGHGTGSLARAEWDRLNSSYGVEELNSYA